MITIKFNNSVEVELCGFNRNIIFHENEVNDSANIEINSTDKNTVMALGATVITSLQIFNNQQSIYELTNVNAMIDAITETLDNEKIITRVTLTFDN